MAINLLDLELMYKRVLLKLSGEQLAGQFGNGIDIEYCKWLAGEVKKAISSGTQLVVVVGSGNLVRGAKIAGDEIGRATADNMGMLTTLVNALALADIFSNNGVDARVVTSVRADQVADPYTYRRAVNHLGKGRAVVVGGGIGRPYFTTDTAAVNLALELGCEAVLKVTKVDGVYDSDPVENPDAKKYDKLSYQEAVENDAIKVMDKAAMGLAMEQHMPLIIFDATKPGTIAKVLNNEPIGTKIS